jgi:hypothetical protein
MVNHSDLNILWPPPPRLHPPLPPTVIMHQQHNRCAFREMSKLIACLCSKNLFADLADNLTNNTLIKKRKKMPHIRTRKSRRERLQSHKLTASSYMANYLRIASYVRKPFLIYDFATVPSEFLYMRKSLFSFFISVRCRIDVPTANNVTQAINRSSY